MGEVEADSQLHKLLRNLDKSQEHAVKDIIFAKFFLESRRWGDSMKFTCDSRFWEICSASASRVLIPPLSRPNQIYHQYLRCFTFKASHFVADIHLIQLLRRLPGSDAPCHASGLIFMIVVFACRYMVICIWRFHIRHVRPKAAWTRRGSRCSCERCAEATGTEDKVRF